MPDAENKLDRLLEAVSEIKASQAAMTAHMDGFRSTADRHEREMDASRQRHDRDIETVLLRVAAVETTAATVATRVTTVEASAGGLPHLRDDVDVLKARPEGITGKQLLAVSASVAGMVWVVIQILQVAVKAIGNA